MSWSKIDQKNTTTKITDFGDLKIYTYKEQDYEKLRQDCISRKALFEDSLFPAKKESIYYTQTLPYGVTWKRPHEICKNPVFVDGNFSAHDLDQGQLGNCWFIAGCSAITLVPELLSKVVPPNQQCNGKDYAGIFHFRFWLYGQWFDVVIDDKLPVTSDNKLLFCRSTESPNEFWAPLLEKAYAKVALCYENLDGGFTTDAIIDMSGGIQETFKIENMRTEKQKDLIWNVLVKSRQHKSMIGASINPNPRMKEARLSNGLVAGHAYTVTRIALVERYGREIKLVRLRNPWGNEVEWRGAWSDKSYEWYSISTDVKSQLEFDSKPDGESWMSFDDFYRNFETVEICNLTPDAFSDETNGKHPSLQLKWNMVAYNGEWIKGKSAGGCGQYDKNAYWTNPQILFSLTDVDPHDNENMATVIISLMQKYTREKRSEKRGEAAEDFIQFRLYRIKNKDDAVKAKSSGLKLYASQLEPAGTSGPYINLRDLTKRFRLPTGEYVIIPSTYDADMEGKFLLRIFTEENIKNDTIKILEDGKDKLNESDTKFFSLDNIPFASWNDLLNVRSSPRTEWRSTYTLQAIRSRSLFQFTLPYRDERQSIYQKVTAQPKPKLQKKENCLTM